MPNLKMLNSTKYLYKLTFIKCSYAFAITTLTWCGMVGKKRHCHDSIDVMQNSGLSICCRYFFCLMLSTMSNRVSAGLRSSYAFFMSALVMVMSRSTSRGLSTVV